MNARSLWSRILIVAIVLISMADAEAQQPPCAYSFGLVAKDTIDLNGNNLYLDSFNSSDPAKSTSNLYDSAKKQLNGNVAVGSSLTNSIDLLNLTVYGSILTEPTGAVASLGPNGSVGPSIINRATTVSAAEASGWIRHDCSLYTPSVVLPRSVGGWSSEGRINNTTTLTFGDYRATDIDLNGSGETLYINGSVRLYVTGNINISGSAGITVLQMSDLTIYTAGSVFIGGNAIVNNASFGLGAPSMRVRLYGLDTSTSWSVYGNGTWIGVIYAPEASLTMHGGGVAGDMSGAVIAKTITLNGPVQFHYDEALRQQLSQQTGMLPICGGPPVDDGITALQLVETDSQVTFPVGAGKSYRVEYNDDLATTNWTRIITTNAASCANETITVTDPGAGNGTQKFYRLRIQPQP